MSLRFWINNFPFISLLSSGHPDPNFQNRIPAAHRRHHRAGNLETGSLLFLCPDAGRKEDNTCHVWLWILCGLPFGLHRMCLWIVPGGGSLGGGIALFALNFIIGGVIGGFVLAWRLIVAVWYVPLTVYRLIVG